MKLLCCWNCFRSRCFRQRGWAEWEGRQWKRCNWGLEKTFTDLKQDVGEEQDVSKGTSIQGFELSKEAETEEDATKALLVVTEKKIFWWTRLRFL